MTTEIAQRAVGIRWSAPNPMAIGLMLVVLFFGISERNSLKAAESYSLRGAYTLSNFDGAKENPEGKKLSEYHAGFAFGRNGEDWRVEIFDGFFASVWKRTKWLYKDGIMYKTAHLTKGRPGLNRTMEIFGDKNLPQFGWHFALTILTVFAPEFVVSHDPPPTSAPIEVFMPYNPSQDPKRIFCEVDYWEEHQTSPLKTLRILAEKSSLSFPETPTIPKDPVLLFECKVSETMEFDGVALPHKFRFQLLNTLETMKSDAAVFYKFLKTLEGDKAEELLRIAQFAGSDPDAATLVKTKELLNFIEKLETNEAKEYLQALKAAEFGAPPVVWRLEAEVDPNSLSRESFTEVHLEGETHVSDYRVILPNGDYVDYMARSNILEPGSKALEDFVRDTTQGSHTTTIYRWLAIGMMILVTFTAFLATRHPKLSKRF